MIIRSAQWRTFATNSLFAAFSLGGIGWGLLHAWGLSVKTGMLFHVLAAMPGLVLSGIVLYRYRQHWPVKATGGALPYQQKPRLPWDFHALAFYLLMIGIGFGIALLISDGSASLLVLGAMGMVLVPWAKIAVCRDHFFFATALLGTGTVSGLLVSGQPVHPLYYPVAAWLLLAVASMAIISVIVCHGNRFDRMPVSGY